MKSNYFRLFLLLSLFVFLSKSKAQAQTINLKALDAYWKITDKLRGGDTISRADWKQFLQLDGNKQYISNQGFDDNFLEFYRKTMQTVYMPQYAKTLEKMMQDKFKYWIAYKINQYQLNEAELKRYAATLGSKNYLDSMYVQAWKWLPKKLQSKHPSTQLFFIGIDNDALVQGDTIVFTLWSAYNQDKLSYGILGGHELHHVLRKPFGLTHIKPEHEGILYALNAALNEGSADMIDKTYAMDNLGKLPMEYDFTDFLLVKPDSIIKQIDTALQSLAKQTVPKVNTIKDYRKLINFSSGHNPGYYMARTIIRNGYQKELINKVQNPFAFVYLYNKAAKKDQQHAPVLSELAIAEVKLLERAYWRK